MDKKTWLLLKRYIRSTVDYIMYWHEGTYNSANCQKEEKRMKSLEKKIEETLVEDN